MKRFKQALATLGIAAVVVAVVGLIVMVTGIVPIKASDGHWEITKWVLDFSKRRSVATHSAGIDPPGGLDEQRRIVQGAGHYETGCVQCHGSPLLLQPTIPQAMTPTPPQLQDRIDRWEAAELFYITKHGIKFTGMPAFPSQQRNDEVWSVVAFLQKLPELDEAGYSDLVYGDELATPTDAGEAESSDLDARPVPGDVVQSCFRCHGRDGTGRNGAFPVLAGQKEQYLKNSLTAYANQNRHSGMMAPIAAALDEDGISAAAEYFSQLRNTSPPASVAEARITAGRRIAEAGVTKQRVGVCNSCHGPGAISNTNYPILAGQPVEYLQTQLRLFQQRRRGGSEHAHLMHAAVDGLTEEQIQEVAAYFASQTTH